MASGVAALRFGARGAMASRQLASGFFWQPSPGRFKMVKALKCDSIRPALRLRTMSLGGTGPLPTARRLETW